MEESKNNSPFIELVNQFWRVNLECSLGTSDVALFFALHHFCNRVGWKRQFACSNRQIMSIIQISDKTLISARKCLIDAGLITFIPGTPKRQKSLYSFCTDYWSYSGSSGGSSGGSNIIREDKTKQELSKNNKKEPAINKKSTLKKVVQPTTPTLEEVLKICTDKGMSEDEAKNFYYYYDAQGWVTTGGQKIKRIDSMVNRWLTNGKSKEYGRNGETNTAKREARNKEVIDEVMSHYK